MIDKINKILVLLIIAAGLIWLYTAFDLAFARHQLNYQLEHRKTLERERDRLNRVIRSYQHYLPDNADKPFPEYIEWKIRSQAAEHSIDPNIAFAIAVCESTLNPYAKNPNSSARGLYQFLEGTWEWIGADGSREDSEEQVRQFMIWYPKNPQWWKSCLDKINYF